ncbi:MAG: PilZ domain-containing protein [Desulfobacterales bacterium]
MIEKRQVERFALKLEAYVVRSDDAPTAESHRLTTRDVSMNGAYLLTSQPLPLGTKVKIDVILSMEGVKQQKMRKALIKAFGEVLRTDGEGMAVEFYENSKFMPFAEDNLEVKT